MIPDGWRKKPLKDVVMKIGNRNSKGNKNILTISAVYGLVDQKEFFNKYVASKNTSNYYLLKKGDFAYNKSYSKGFPVGVIRRLELFDSGIVSPLYICFRIDSKIEISSKYLLYHFDSSYFIDEISNIAAEGARNHGLLNVKPIDFFGLIVLLPPLPEQKKIADILTSIDEAIQTTQKVIDQSEKVKHGLLHDLLTKGIGHTEFKMTDIGEIPVEWEVTKLGDICDFINGRGFKPHEWGSKGLPIIRIQNLNGVKEYHYYSGQFDTKILVNTYDLLFAWSGSRGTSFGPYIWKNPPGLLNYHTWKIKIFSNIDTGYLYESFQKITKEVENDAHGASALVHMQKAFIINYKIPLPPLLEQKQIAAILSSVDKSIQKSKNKKTQLEQVKKGLMQDLLTGKVRVKV